MGPAADSYDVFFSYHRPDQAAVEGVAQALRQQGLKVFLDCWYLVPGRPWPQVLEEVIASCRAVAVFVGPAGLGPWQQREKNLALSRWSRQTDFPVIPVLLPGADPALDFLSQNTWVDLRPRLDDPLSLEILQAAIRGEPPGPDLKERVQATLAAVCPYRGLRPFREEDAPFFFGREVFVHRLTQAVGLQALVAVVGASGCGKSSVARAGLIPRLRRNGGGPVWEAVTLLPGDRPLYALAGALLPLLEPEMSEVDRLAEVGKLAAYLQQGDLALRDVVARVLAKQPGTDRLLLVADQWEELYTLTREEEQRGRFLDEILQATQDSPLSVVLTLRGDFFGQALSYRPLADRLQDAVVTLGPMTREELAQAVAEPARKVHLTFEAGLVERLLDDVGLEPGNLPLLEFALTRLWEQRRGGQLLHQVYEDMGRVQGAVAQQAEEVYQKLGALEQQAAVRVFLELVQTGENTEDTRRRAALSDLGDETRDLVKKLADARLVVTGREEATGLDLVEVAHEALIRHWQRLQGWLNADREFLLWRQRLRHDLEDWQRTGQDEGALLRGAQLVEAEGWHTARAEHLTPGEREFIQASLALREKEQRSRQRQQRRRILLLTAGLVTTLVLMTFGWWQWRQADALRFKAEDLIFFLVESVQKELKRSGLTNLMEQVENRVEAYYRLEGTSSWRGEYYQARKFDQQGDRLLSQGKLPEAQQAYEAALARFQLLTLGQPEKGWISEGYKHVLVAQEYEKVGEALKAQGRLAEARQAYEAALATIQQKSWLVSDQELAFRYGKLGDILLDEGKLPEARRALESALAIIQPKFQQEPESEAWQWTLSVLYGKMGNLQLAEGNIPEAQRSFESSLNMCQRLVQKAPDYPGWQEELAKAYERIGNILKVRGKSTEARQAYESSLSIMERLTQKYPAQLDFQNYLGSCHGKLGEVLAEQGKTNAALKSYEAGKVIAARLVRLDGTNAQWQRDLEWFEQRISGIKKRQ